MPARRAGWLDTAVSSVRKSTMTDPCETSDLIPSRRRMRTPHSHRSPIGRSPIHEALGRLEDPPPRGKIRGTTRHRRWIQPLQAEQIAGGHCEDPSTALELTVAASSRRFSSRLARRQAFTSTPKQPPASVSIKPFLAAPRFEHRPAAFPTASPPGLGRRGPRWRCGRRCSTSIPRAPTHMSTSGAAPVRSHCAGSRWSQDMTSAAMSSAMLVPAARR